MKIKYKITVLLILCSLIPVMVGLGMGYLRGFNLLRDTIGENQVKIAKVTGAAIERIIDEEISDIETFMSHRGRIDEIEKFNFKYKDMDAGSIKQYFTRMDKEWALAAENDPLIKEYLDTPTSKRLKIITETETDIGEIFMTDKFGGLVASSNKTSDFYQADEKWWQEAFAGGQGKVSIQDIEFDESSGVPGLSIAVPIKNHLGETIGVCKAVLDIGRLFKPLEAIVIEKTGHISLIDGKGYILFHERIKALTARLFQEKEFKKITEKDTDGYIVTHTALNPKIRQLVSYALVGYPAFLEKDIHWRVCVEQELEEVFLPVKRLMGQLLVLTFILLAVLLVLVYIFSGIFVKPIKSLQEGVERIGGGDLDYQVKVKTGDELEEFADSFNNMVGNLKKTTTSISLLNKEMENREKVDMALIAAKKRTQEYLDVSEAMVLELDLKGNVLHLNRRGCEIMETEETALVGRNWFDFCVPEPERKKDKELFNKAISEKRDATYLETKIITKTGKQKYIYLHNTIIKDSEQKIIRTLSSAIDITKIKEAEKALEEAAEIKTKFASIASHEVRGALANVYESLKLVLDGLTGKLNDKQRHFLNMAKEELGRINRLTSDILDFQKLAAGKMKFNFKKNNINKVIKEIHETIHSLAEQKELYFKLNLKKDMSDSEFDKDKITQVLVNLINNAVKFTKKGGIVVSTTSEGNFIQVTVRDTGCGIKKEDLSELFKTFTQLKTTKEKGTGLGLSICKEITDGHKGKIWAESDFGKGSAFHFVLPVKERREIG